MEWVPFFRQYRFLSKVPASTSSGQRALFVSLTHHPVYALIEGMLLLALRIRGVQPVVLTYRAARWPIRTFRVFGICDFLFFDEDLKAVATSDDDRLFDKLFSGKPTFKQLLDFAVEDSETGAHALSTVVRKLRTGGGELGDERTRKIIRSAFLESLRASRAAKKLFARERFDHVLFHEKGYSPFGEIFDQSLKQGFDSAQYYFGQLPNSIVLKRYTVANRREHPFSLSKKTWDAIRKAPWSAAEENAFRVDLRRSYEEGTWFGRKFLLKDKKLKTPEEVKAQLHLDPAKKTAVIYSHILWDATFFYGKNLFDDYEQWLVETVKVACKNIAVNWIIKLHPDYVWKMKDMPPGTDPRDVTALRDFVGPLPSHVQIVMPDIDITTYSFFAATDYCITVRGTIGTEAPCFGIPVFTAGTGRYSDLGFTHDSATREEYLDKIERIQEFPRLTPEQTSLALRHAHTLFERRLWRHTSFSTDRTKLKGGALDHHVKINLHAPKDLEGAADLRQFADWILQSTDEDYLV
jgi:hypothetical protein